MRRTVRVAVATMACISVFTIWPLSAQEPVPARVRVFIANGGGDFGAGLSTVNAVEGDIAERAYNEFFSGMKDWAHYQLVANPARADWVFEIGVRNHQTCVPFDRRDTKCRGFKRDGRDSLCLHNDYRIELVMMDTKTFGVRKHFVEHVKEAGYFSDPKLIFDRAVAALVSDVKQEAGERLGKTPVIGNAVPVPPAPPSIGQAQTVIINNVSPFDADADRYSGGKAEVSAALSSALLKWGRYKLTANEADADLVLQVSFSVETNCIGSKDPQLKLSVVDSRTGILLWTFLEHVSNAVVNSDAHRNFIREMGNLISQLRGIADTPTWELAPATDSIASPIPVATQIVPASSVNAAPVPVSISLMKEVVKPGDRIDVHVRMKNNLKQDLSFSYPEGDPLTCVVIVHDENGNPVADTRLGLALQAQHDSLQRPALSYALHPGEAQTRDCNVSELYEMSAPGRYSIEVQQFDGRPVHSNVVAVSVVP